MGKFWLFDWLDEFQVTSSDQAASLLQLGNPAIERLHEIAATVVWAPAHRYDGSGVAILAGRGIDLSGDLDCCHRVCQRRQVDALFGRVLHYFDDIVVAGPPAHRYAELLADPTEEALHNLSEHADVLLYLREIGAEDMLTFVEKRPACAEHYRQHAKEAGIEAVVEAASHWIDRLEESGSIADLREHENHWHYRFDHPALEHTAWGVVQSQVKGRTPSSRDVAGAVFATYAAHLVSDVLTARDTGLPLGASVDLHESVLEGTAPTTAANVAFELELPVLAQLPVRDIVKLRQDESEYFERFRVALTAAIQERITGAASSASVADRVYEEIIEPALVDLDRRLRTAERALARKLGASVAFGALVTGVGLITGAPLVIGAGVAGIGTSIPAAHKYFDERGQIELSDMYFLWGMERRSLPGKRRH